MYPSADQLRVFAVVMDAGSVTAAARLLHVSQPAVSARLRSLQTLAGGPLYVRRQGTLVPTDLGAALLPHARTIAGASQRIDALLDVSRDAAPQVTVAISETAGSIFLPVIAREAVLEPPLALSAISVDAARAIDLVRSRVADLAVTVGVPAAPKDDLMRRQLSVQPIVLVSPPERRARRHVTLGAVRDQPILWQSRGSGVRATVEQVLNAAGIWPQSELEMGSSMGVLTCVAGGLGSGLLPAGFAEPWRRAGLVDAATFDAPAMVARFELTSPADTELPPGAARLIARLLEPVP